MRDDRNERFDGVKNKGWENTFKNISNSINKFAGVDVPLYKGSCFSKSSFNSKCKNVFKKILL